jgi:hypothetical protein
MKLKRAMRVFLLLAIPAVMMACVSTDAKWRDADYVTQIADFDGYREWLKINPESVTGDVFGVLGPAHAGSEGFRDIYVNKMASSTITGGTSVPFDVGSIIVKETYAPEPGEKGPLAALTIMVKRGGGYYPESADWEYIMLSPDMEVAAQGRLDSCAGCHMSAEDRDYIFFTGYF